MDKQILKQTAVNSIALMLIVVIISIVISQDNQNKIYANSMMGQEDLAVIQNVTSSTVIESNLSDVADSIYQQLGDKYIIIKKSDCVFDEISIEDLYMERSISIMITGLNRKAFDEDSFVRMNDGKEFSGKPVIEVTDTHISSDSLDQGIKQAKAEEIESTENINPITDFMQAVSIQYIIDENTNLYQAVINIGMDDIYAPALYEDDENIYIDLRRPKDVYDRIIVVDAGHGGTDCGTFSAGEEYYEKDINLSIVLYLKEILDQENIKVYYTRTTDKTVYLNPRVNLANDLDADFFLSIHCNANESSQPNGLEVLYNELSHTLGRKSQQFARICLDELTKVTDNVNRGLVNGNEILIIGKAKVPVALVEVGFMSNQADLKFLLQEDNKKQIANALYDVIKRAYKEIKLY